MARKNQGRSPKQRERDADKRKEALGYKIQGMSLEQIRVRMGYACRSSVQQLISRALDDVWQPPAEEVRRLELERLDHDESMAAGIAEATYEAAKLADEHAVKAFMGALDKTIKIRDQRARFYGLYVLKPTAPEDARRIEIKLLPPDEPMAAAADDSEAP